jgi:emfourin
MPTSKHGAAMKITFEMNGGFAPIPALSGPITTDTTQIGPELANQLESLVRESHFFDKPARVATMAKGAADYRAYTITVQDGPRIHSVQLIDPITDANFERLVSLLRLTARPPRP